MCIVKSAKQLNVSWIEYYHGQYPSILLRPYSWHVIPPITLYWVLSDGLWQIASKVVVWKTCNVSFTFTANVLKTCSVTQP